MGFRVCIVYGGQSRITDESVELRSIGIIGMKTDQYQNRIARIQYFFAIVSLFLQLPFCASASEGVLIEKAQNSLLIPHRAWDCGMPRGIPAPESGKKISEVNLKIADSYHIGKTQYGDRWVCVIQSGTIKGEGIEGKVLFGALDLQLTLENGVIEIEQILNLQTNDGRNIYLRCAGVGKRVDDIRIVCTFDAPNMCDQAWLNEGVFVARREIDMQAGSIKLLIYQFTTAIPSTDNVEPIKIAKPADVPYQSWEFRVADANEERGDRIIQENVTLGPSLFVGPTRSGIRNTIPITGGKLTGEINGIVLPGGADYQQLVRPAIIDARYLWQTESGEIILVRNAGHFGKLVPTFEATESGPHAWLNTGRYLSSDPAMGQGGVKLEFYRSK